MFKKICVVFLSICIAVAIVLGENTSYSSNCEQNVITMCDMEAAELSY